MWIQFAFLGAIFQAIEMAIKKKTLQVQGMNNVIALIAYTFAGLLMLLLYFFQSGHMWVNTILPWMFWNGVFWTVLLNMVGVWFMYKALDIADLSYLMPLMTLTSLSLVVPPMIIFGEFPTPKSFLGILVVVLGALLMDYKFKKNQLSEEDHILRKNNRKGASYFLITALCYTFTPTVTKVAILESNVIFATYVVHLLTGAGFVLLIGIIAISKSRSEMKKSIGHVLKEEFIKTKNQLSDAGLVFLIAVLFAGLAIAIQNGSINYAFTIAPIANVMAIKRTMPIFAFVIGLIYFKERKNILQKFIATIIMISGAMIITFAK